MRVIAPGLLSVFLLAAHGGTLAAQEFCVACSGPAAVYRCVIADARQAQGQPLQQYCTTALARQGGHAECGIRKGTVFDCDGPIKRIGEASSGPDKSGQPPKASAEPEKPKARENVADSVRDLSRDTGKQVEKTGEAAKSAAKGVWNCVTSFFKSC
ncbi:MAG: hypothetical protein ABWZ74_09410 [Hyphomicrobiaceae bacterium]